MYSKTTTPRTKLYFKVELDCWNHDLGTDVTFVFQEHIVVLMAADAMDVNMQIILKDPKWSQRVVYMRGSALKDTDLKRCRIADAEACFILAPRYIKDRSKAVSMPWMLCLSLRLNQKHLWMREQNKIYNIYMKHWNVDISHFHQVVIAW